MLHKLIRGIAPVAAFALGAMAAGCDNMNMRIDGSDGVPLAELDTSGEPPTKLVLAGPDRVILTEGQALDIDVSGDPQAVEALRFTLEDGTLGVLRDQDSRDIDGTAIVRVAMPSPKSIVLAGSGVIEAASMSGPADVTVAGSGTVRAAGIAADSLDLTIAGSGAFEGAGAVERLDLTIAGSGSAEMAALSVGTADVSVAGSGAAEFASDGAVEANIMGSGNVTVIGRANCTVNSMGSGSLDCRPAASNASAEGAAAADERKTEGGSDAPN